MKFLYEYRTKDNAVHDGVVSASNRDDAFATLKKRGIKPSRLVEAPGLFNKLFGKGKRWIAIVVLAVATGISAFFALTTSQEAELTLAKIDSTTRRQVIGDAAVIDEGIRTAWAGALPEEGDRFLASFAIPGVVAAQRSTSEEEIRRALEHDVAVSENDSLEIRQVKAMLRGMKEELREFLSDGGTIRQYGRRLVQRQEAELAYYHRAKNEVDRAFADGQDPAVISDLLAKHNASLRKMGIRLIVMPE